MNDSNKAETITVSNSFKVIDARTVKVKQVQDFQSLLNDNINFQSLRQAVMINDKLLIGPKISAQQQPQLIRQWYLSKVSYFLQNQQ